MNVPKRATFLVRNSLPQRIAPIRSPAFYYTAASAEQPGQSSEPSTSTTPAPSAEQPITRGTEPFSTSPGRRPYQRAVAAAASAGQYSKFGATGPGRGFAFKKPTDPNQGSGPKSVLGSTWGTRAGNSAVRRWGRRAASNEEGTTAVEPEPESSPSNTPWTVPAGQADEGEQLELQQTRQEQQVEETHQGINWASSYHGISAKPVSVEQFQLLMEELDVADIEVKPDGVVYLPEIKYRRKLNQVFGPMGWGIIPRGEPAVGESIVTREYALFVDGRFASQAQGENTYFGPDTLPAAVEGCKSNALMRCCKDLGIASELWDPHYIQWHRKNHMEGVWVEHVTTKKKRQLWYKKGQVNVVYPYKKSLPSRRPEVGPEPDGL